ncbi:MAG: 50S ribosomal protein L11 methyltransferase [Pseudomonadales bacterium]
MECLQVSIVAARDDVPLLEDAVLSLGALSISLVDAADTPLYEPGVGETPLWQSLILRALFSADRDASQLIVDLGSVSEKIDRENCRVELLEDKDWLRNWMDSYKPLRIGQRLWVCPSWKPVPSQCEVALRLDPGLAFGTGTHPTTALCLEWLDAQPCSGKTVLDYGCGSGILALAAALLGATQVHAIDNDPQALTATRDNAERNNITGQINIIAASDPSYLSLHADILLANILAAPLIELASLLQLLLAPGGILVLSGLLESQVEAVRSAYAATIVFDEPVVRQEWVRLVGQKLV